ncbi:hypothetical protein [Pseudoclavibacter sp. AY1H1]|uniref:hypothetical protein n=1 Tax=Pseudoclavibacter sp. AY1H1 TaxID=2080584 RepID=UPI000CE885FC|nr:hypothetical protein [Pseudoclavibacter sp. AY1H1]PPF38352.1 hypothetical protein C5E05_04890 [Pseudoclavibacter sp. AY1H1]
MRSTIVILYVLAALLPLVGLVRLYLLARKEAQPVRESREAVMEKVKGDQVDQLGLYDEGFVSYAEVQAGMPIIVAAVRNRPQAVLADLLFIGVGVVMGAVASVWSLFL